MDQNLAAFTPEKYSMKMVELLYNEGIYQTIANTNYEGEIRDSGDTVNIRTAGRITWSPYSKQMKLVHQNLNPVNEKLVIDQEYYFSFEVDNIDKLQNDIDTINEYAENSYKDLSEVLDDNLLQYARRNVHGANALGTPYSTGTVAVSASGVVTLTGGVFPLACVGAFFTTDDNPEGRDTKYYRIKTRTSITSAQLENLDGTAYAETAVAAGTSYVLNAATAVALTSSNVYQYLVDLGKVLGKRLTPKKGRFIVINSDFEAVIRMAPQFIPAVESAYQGVVKDGRIGMIAGFTVLMSELVPGDNSNGYWFFAGTSDFMALAMQIMKTSIVSEKFSQDTFTDICKGLCVWGRKVCEGNRGRGAILRATF